MVMRIRSSDSNCDFINIEMIPDGYKFGTMNAFIIMMIKDAAQGYSTTLNAGRKNCPVRQKLNKAINE